MPSGCSEILPCAAVVVLQVQTVQLQRLLPSVHLPSHHISLQKITFNTFIFKGLHKYKLSQPFAPVELEFITKPAAKAVRTFLLKDFLAGYKDCDILVLKLQSVSGQTIAIWTNNATIVHDAHRTNFFLTKICVWLKAAKFQGRKVVWVLVFDRTTWKALKKTLLAKHETKLCNSEI